MAANAAPTAHPASHQDIQATALWTFVHLRVPRFTNDLALKVIKDLQPTPYEAPKLLAKRLRNALSDVGVSLKHTAELDAASRILGHSSWRACDWEHAAPKLKLTVLHYDLEEHFLSWHELAPRLAERLEAWHKAKHVKVFEIRFGSDLTLVCFPMPKQGSLEDEAEMIPTLALSPIGEAKGWQTEAPAAFESVRRRLEETNKDILDGVATLQICGRHGPDVLTKTPPIPQPVTPDDTCNSELVLLREDNEMASGYSFEIARGDEMTCWSQLELAVKDEAKGQPLEISLEEGAWRVGQGRYVWQMTTLHPDDYVPGQIYSTLTEVESEKLLRRYRLAKRILGGKVKHHHVTKPLKFLYGLQDTYSVDLHRVCHALHNAGYEWNSFCAETGIELDMVPEVKVGFVMTLAKHLKLEDPIKLFASPPRGKLAKAVDNTLIRSLMPGVDFVRYRLPQGLDSEQIEGVRDALVDFSSSIRLQQIQQLGEFIDPDDPLPYHCYAGDGEELRLKLEALDLEMYVGLMPYLVSTEGVFEKIPGAWSFAFGHTLYLDIDRVEEGA